jgi:hypothetical protein
VDDEADDGLLHGRSVPAHSTDSLGPTGVSLLVAAVTLCTGMPRLRAVLDAHGVTVAAVRHEIAPCGEVGATVPHEDDRIACTPAVVRVLARAAQLAGPLERVRPHHVLLALCDGVDDPSWGAAHDVLERIGVEPRRFRRAVGRAARRP